MVAADDGYVRIQALVERPNPPAGGPGPHGGPRAWLKGCGLPDRVGDAAVRRTPGLGPV